VVSSIQYVKECPSINTRETILALENFFNILGIHHFFSITSTYAILTGFHAFFAGMAEWLRQVAADRCMGDQIHSRLQNLFG
jgi:hypothetical protein